MSDFATNMEIEYAERVLLPEGCHFSEAKRTVIKRNDIADFHACPGSGKTTTLLAKIVILANRMPFADGRGICVLTHTNVAIDEIKARLGEKANVLFTYPNFFGTFQTFVHKFFTDEEISQLSVVAPNVVLNIIKDYEVVEKKTVETPDELRGIVKCNNPKCITNNEPMQTIFHVVDKSNGILKCHYCDKEQDINKVELA